MCVCVCACAYMCDHINVIMQIVCLSLSYSQSQKSLQEKMEASLLAGRKRLEEQEQKADSLTTKCSQVCTYVHVCTLCVYTGDGSTGLISSHAL